MIGKESSKPQASHSFASRGLYVLFIAFAALVAGVACGLIDVASGRVDLAPHATILGSLATGGALTVHFARMGVFF